MDHCAIETELLGAELLYLLSCYSFYSLHVVIEILVPAASLPESKLSSQFGSAQSPVVILLLEKRFGAQQLTRREDDTAQVLYLLKENLLCLDQFVG